MKKILFLILALTLTFSPYQAAKAEEIAYQEPDSGAIVCAPGIYLQKTDDCLPLGPSETLTNLARSGLVYPLQPLPVVSPDPALNYSPYLYFKVDSTGTNFYPSLDAAISKAGSNRSLAPGKTLYVTYIDRVEGQPGGVYYMLPSGEWMHGDGSRVSVPVFQGVEMSSTPRNAFGWVLSDANVRRAPNFNYDNLAIKTLYRFNMVQIYNDFVAEDGYRWLMIGPDEWIEDRLVATITPNTAPPNGVTGDRWIDVNLAEQTLAVYEDRRMVYATLISTGVEPFWTRPGTFQIYQKKELENMSGAFEADRSDYYYLENVPWTMYFDKARALHGSYWHTYFGYPQSHGCVNLSVGDSAWLFNWAKDGDWVWVHDPSGLTPTDPAIYGDGGA